MIALTEQEKKEMKETYGKILGTLQQVTPEKLQIWKAEAAELAEELAPKPKFPWGWVVFGGIVLTLGYTWLKK